MMKPLGRGLMNDVAFLGGQGRGQINIAGHFRVMQHDDAGNVLADSGWVHNCMTWGGITCMLGRLVYIAPDDETTFNGWIDCSSTLSWTLPIAGMGVGTGTDADYDYFHKTADGLQNEVTYLSGATRAARGNPIDLNYGMVVPAVNDPRTVPTRLMVSGTWAAGEIVATGNSVSLSEVGLFDDVTGGAGAMYCAAYFTPVLITGGHPVTAYYTLGISQAAP